MTVHLVRLCLYTHRCITQSFYLIVICLYYIILALDYWIKRGFYRVILQSIFVILYSYILAKLTGSQDSLTVLIGKRGLYVHPGPVKLTGVAGPPNRSPAQAFNFFGKCLFELVAGSGKLRKQVFQIRFVRFLRSVPITFNAIVIDLQKVI